MKTDKQIIDAMLLQDEKDAIRQEMLQNELHERNMRTDVNYFLNHSKLHELREMHHKLSQKALRYGWCDLKVKDYL